MKTQKTILLNSWRIIKQNKFLWLLGFLSLSFMGGGEFSLVYQFYKINNNLINSFVENVFANQYVSLRFDAKFWFGLILIFVALVLVSFFQMSIIRIIRKIKNEQYRGWREIFRSKIDNLIRFFSLNVVTYGFIYAIALVLAVLSRMIFDNIETQTSFIVLAITILIIPLSIIVSFVRRYAAISLVDNFEKNIFVSLAAGWYKFIHNWFETLKGTIISLLILFLSSVLTSMFIAVLSWPTLFILRNINISSVAVVEIGAIAIFVYALVVTCIVAAMFGGYYMTYWVNLYDNLDD